MRLEEILLVKERNQEGKEVNYLSNLSDYFIQVSKNGSGSVQEMADAARKLYATKTDMYGWAEFYSSQNTVASVRFCASESELQGFLLGMYNHTENKNIPYIFDEERCSVECFGVLQAYGLDTSGHDLFGSMHYEPLEHDFKNGEIIHNFNGKDYRILSVLSPDNLLLMGVSDGQFVAGIGVQMYERYPKEQMKMGAGTVVAVEWQHGVYLGSDITKIDCDILKQDYGKPEKITSVYGLREKAREDFYKHRNIADNKNLSEKVRNAAKETLWERYSTEDISEFGRMLENGRYDDIFPERKRKIPGKSR